MRALPVALARLEWLIGPIPMEEFRRLQLFRRLDPAVAHAAEAVEVPLGRQRLAAPAPAVCAEDGKRERRLRAECVQLLLIIGSDPMLSLMREIESSPAVQVEDKDARVEAALIKRERAPVTLQEACQQLLILEARYALCAQCRLA